VKRRSPWLLYIGLLVSGGLFVFVWIILLMRDVNQFEERIAFPVKPITMAFISALLIYFISIVSLVIAEHSTARQILLVFIIAIGMTINLLLIVLIARLALHISTALGHAYPVMFALMSVVLTFLAGLSLVVLQYQMNTLINRLSPRPMSSAD
jgi:hypothetical protein